MFHFLHQLLWNFVCHLLLKRQCAVNLIELQEVDGSAETECKVKQTLRTFASEQTSLSL